MDLKKLLCRHDYIVKCNISGYGAWEFGYRTKIRCRKCGKVEYIRDYIPHGEIIDL